MATDNSQHGFRRGVMSMVILGLLKKEDMYGYQLVQETKKQSGGRITTQEGSLYPVLYKLLDQGLISDRKVLVGKRMTRVYYHLEPAGANRLAELLHEYEEITNGVFLIVKEGEHHDRESPSPLVSVDSLRETARNMETEEKNSLKSEKLNPGISF